MEDIEKLIFLMESDEYTNDHQALSTEDAQDVAFFKESIKQEVEETTKNAQHEKSKEEERTLSKQARRMRRGTRSLKVRQKFADKQISQKNSLLQLREKIKMTEQLDNTRCLKEGTT